MTIFPSGNSVGSPKILGFLGLSVLPVGLNRHSASESARARVRLNWFVFCCVISNLYVVLPFKKRCHPERRKTIIELFSEVELSQSGSLK